MGCSKTLRSMVIVAIGLFCLQHASIRAQQGQPAKTDTKTPAVVAAPKDSEQAEYVGADTCKACHADLYSGWEKSPHWQQTYKEGGIAKHGCEDCHGPGSLHVAGGGDKTKIFIFQDALDQGDRRPLHDLPRGGHAAHERHQFRAYEERRELHCVPFAAPR